ncbi:unnamed protein product [Boreogadus saida]
MTRGSTRFHRGEAKTKHQERSKVTSAQSVQQHQTELIKTSGGESRTDASDVLSEFRVKFSLMFILFQRAEENAHAFLDKELKMSGKEKVDGVLERIHSKFVEKVTDPVIKGLLDDLWLQKVFNTEEKDSVTEEQRSRADQARCLIGMVIRKGERASHVMIESMKKRDEHLCINLGLISSLASVGELLP